MPAPRQTLSGPEKAVLFLLSLDKETAAPIVEKLSDEELHQLRRVAAGMKTVTPQAFNEMFYDFLSQASRLLPVPNGGVPYLKQLTARAHGGAQAEAIFGAAGEQPPLQRLEKAHPQTVASLLENESPRLCAALLARLKPEASQKILQAMVPAREAAVLTSMAGLEELPSVAMDEVAKALAEQLPAWGAETVQEVDGVARAADVLNAAGRTHADDALAWMGAAKPELADDVRLAMFTFEDLARVERRDMRTLLREVSSEQLTVALKDAPRGVSEAIYEGLSERARRLIVDDLEVMGRVRQNEIKAARKYLVQAALRLENEGVIDLGRE